MIQLIELFLTIHLKMYFCLQEFNNLLHLQTFIFSLLLYLFSFLFYLVAFISMSCLLVLSHELVHIFRSHLNNTTLTILNQSQCLNHSYVILIKFTSHKIFKYSIDISFHNVTMLQRSSNVLQNKMSFISTV